MSQRRHVLFVHAMYPHKLPAYQAARRLGYRVSVVGPELPDWARPYVDGYIAGGTGPSEIADTIGRLAERHRSDPFDGVVTYWDHGVLPCAQIGGALNLPASSPAAAERVRNKAASRDALAHAGIRQPRYARVADADGLAQAAGWVGLPAVYKPCGGAGSAGVQHIASAADLARAQQVVQTLLTPERDSFFGYYPGEFLLEEFVCGVEVSVEGIVADGRPHCVGVTAKSLSPGTFLESQHVFPAMLAQPDRQAAIAIAEDAVRATGIDWCGFHVELILTADGPAVVEVNGRLGGDFIASHLVPLACGVDLMAASLQAAVGECPDLRPTSAGAACVRFMVAERAGTVLSATGVERARQLPGVSELGQNKGPGDRVLLPPDSYFDARLAYVISHAETAEDAERIAGQALAEVRYVLG